MRRGKSLGFLYMEFVDSIFAIVTVKRMENDKFKLHYIELSNHKLYS
jgi:hypothetical protein